jgi:ATP-dependent RNA helicase SUPV3L1/SUV3
MPEVPRAGLTSFLPSAGAPEAFYRAGGDHLCGPRAVRIDMLERLADHIRPLLAWRSGSEGAAVPKGATGDGGFTATPEMMSLLGCSPEELGGVLKALGFRVERRPGKKASELPASAPEPTVPAEMAVETANAPAPSTDPEAEAPATAAAPAEPEFEEIWRPRRHPRGERRRDATHKAKQPEGARAEAQTAPVQPQQPATSSGNGRDAKASMPREARRERNKDGGERGRDAHPRRSPDRRRREERRKSEVLTAAPPRRAGVDADSPFAALGALRDELAKRSKESGS